VERERGGKIGLTIRGGNIISPSPDFSLLIWPHTWEGKQKKGQFEPPSRILRLGGGNQDSHYEGKSRNCLEGRVRRRDLKVVRIAGVGQGTK